MHPYLREVFFSLQGASDRFTCEWDHHRVSVGEGSLHFGARIVIPYLFMSIFQPLLHLLDFCLQPVYVGLNFLQDFLVR